MKQQIGVPAIAIAVIVVIALLVFLGRTFMAPPATQSQNELNPKTMKPSFATKPQTGGPGSPGTGGSPGSPNMGSGGSPTSGSPPMSGGR